MSKLLTFRPTWKLSVATQIVSICLLFAAYCLYAFTEYRATGKVWTYYPLQTSILFAPIYEEIIFRGWILGSFLENTSKRNAIIFSSLLFGLWHLKNIFYLPAEQLLFQIAYTTLLFGPIMAYISIRTQTIWIGVILHYLNNLLVPPLFLFLHSL